MGAKSNAASHGAIQYTMCNTIHNAQCNTQCSMYNYGNPQPGYCGIVIVESHIILVLEIDIMRLLNHSI